MTITEGLADLSAEWVKLRGLLTDADKREICEALIQDVTITKDDAVTVTGMLSPLGGTNIGGHGGRYWIRTSDLCDVNAAL